MANEDGWKLNQTPLYHFCLLLSPPFFFFCLNGVSYYTGSLNYYNKKRNDLSPERGTLA